jgi:hypothetical protein
MDVRARLGDRGPLVGRRAHALVDADAVEAVGEPGFHDELEHVLAVAAVVAVV